VPGHESTLWNGLLAYLGPGPGVEFIPYFLGLLAWAGMALGAILAWPIAALIGRFRKVTGQPTQPTGNRPESPGETSRDKP